MTVKTKALKSTKASQVTKDSKPTKATNAKKVGKATAVDAGREHGPMRKADVRKFDPNGAGLTDAGVFGLPFTADECSVVLVPVPWEATVSYGRGTVNGPKAILEASPQLDLFDAALLEHGLARPWEYGIFMEEPSSRLKGWNEKACKLARPIVESGGITHGKKEARALEEVNELCARMNEWVHERVSTWLAAGRIVGVVGGDHSVSFGAIRAAAEKFPGLGILHIDAHADLRDAFEGFHWSHASIMHNVLTRVPGVAKLVQVGIRDFCDAEYEITQKDDRVNCHFDFAIKRALLEGRTWKQIVDDLVAPLPQHVYVSFDVDGLEPWLCPGTGTPVPGGLSYEQAVYLVEALVRHGKTVVAFDLNEVSPSDRHGAEWDGNVGARLLYKLCGVALATNGAKT